MSEETSNYDYFRTRLGTSNSMVTRRTFLKSSMTTLLGLAGLPFSCAPESRSNTRPVRARFGIVTDCHYADADTLGTRFYRESTDKLTECIGLMNAQKVDFLVELGDFKDQGRPPVEQETLSYLQDVERVFQGFDGSTYHVLGNHDLDSISKTQFLARVDNTNIDSSRTYFSFDLNALHYVVLDANYKSDSSNYDHDNFDWTDANIPSEELTWLKQELAEAPGFVIIFIHQLLDGIGPVYVNNAADVRQILQASGKVLAVFQGHHHSGSYSNIAGIHYYTLKAMIEGSGLENNSYAIAEVYPDGTIAVTGYRKAESRQLSLNLVLQDSKSVGMN